MDRKILTVLFICLTITAGAVNIQTHYASLEGKAGAELFNALMALGQNHTKLSYDKIRADKIKIDIINGNVVDIYSNCSFVPNDYCGSGTYDGECYCYNREHLVPRSWWAKTTDYDTYALNSDLVHVFPTDYLANSQRGNNPLDNVVSNSWTNNAGARLGRSEHYGNVTAFEVPDEYKGDVARVYFYVVTTYRNVQLNLANGGRQMFSFSGGVSTFTSTARQLMLQWAEQDPISDKEIKRNNDIHNKQGNRNPFIDLPDLYRYLWGDKINQPYHLPTGLYLVEELNFSIETEGLNLTITTPSEQMVAIYDITGQVVYMQNIDEAATTISLPRQGLYLVQVGKQTTKIIVQ